MSDPSKTALELSLRPERNEVFHGLRALVVTTDRDRARLLSNAVADRGGALFSVDPIAFDPITLSEVDLEVLFLDDRDGEAIDRVERIAHEDQRLRWAAQVRLSLEELTRGETIDEAAFANAVRPHVYAERALEETLRTTERHTALVEPLGPSRILRMATQTGPWCLRYFGARAIGSIEVSDSGRVELASWDEEGDTAIHWEGAPALFAFRSITSGAIEIERPETEHVSTSAVQPVAEVTVQRPPPQVLLARSRDREATVRAKIDFAEIAAPNESEASSRGSFDRDGRTERTEKTPNPFLAPDAPRPRADVVRSSDAPLPLLVRKRSDDRTPTAGGWGSDFLSPSEPMPQMPRRFRPTAPRAPVDDAPHSEPVIPLERRRH
jgi:hypothetical protein